MTAPLLVADLPRPGVATIDSGGGPIRPGAPAVTPRDYFPAVRPAPRGRVVATRPPADSPTLWDVIADYMAAEWGEGE